MSGRRHTGGRNADAPLPVLEWFCGQLQIHMCHLLFTNGGLHDVWLEGVPTATAAATLDQSSVRFCWRRPPTPGITFLPSTRHGGQLD